jgi:type III secretion system low calcium response chaperone LcrH/SycD
MDSFAIAPEALEKIRNKESLLREFQSAPTPGAILGLSSDTLAKFYRSALHLLEERHYAEASKAFLFLVVVNPSNFDCWLGLGMSVQMLGDYEGGIDAYEMAAFLNVENPVSYFYLSKCFFAMHDRENSKQALEMAIEYADENPDYAALKHQAQAALALINQEL